MPLALGMLLIVTLVAGGVSALSINASDEARDDRSAKRALSAAEAGLQLANLRLNNVPTLAANACLVGTASGAECPTYAEESLGNGATARYWVSQRLAVGDTCGRIPTQTSTGTERCITSAGIVDGIQRRLQSRVLDFPTISSLVPVPGVFALNRVQFHNNTTVVGRVGSNKQVISNNTLTTQGVDIGTTGTVTGNYNYTQAPTAPVVFSPDKTLTAVPVGNTATVNRNGSIVNGGGVTYTAATRSLALSGATLTLTQSGDYNFCRITEMNGSSIRLAAGVSANIFVDAPNAVRPGSGCSSGDGWGEIVSQGALSLNNPGTMANFKLFVVGWAPTSAYASSNGLTYLDFQNNFILNGLFYAPYAHADFKNNATVTGASALYEVDFKNNSNFTYGSAASDWDDPRVHFQVQGWRECRSQPTSGSDPESGC